MFLFLGEQKYAGKSGAKRHKMASVSENNGPTSSVPYSMSEDEGSDKQSEDGELRTPQQNSVFAFMQQHQQEQQHQQQQLQQVGGRNGDMSLDFPQSMMQRMFAMASAAPQGFVGNQQLQQQQQQMPDVNPQTVVMDEDRLNKKKHRGNVT